MVGTLSRPRASYSAIEAARLAWVEPHVEFASLDLRDHSAFAALVERGVPRVWIQHAGYATNYGSLDYDLVAAQAINVAPLDALYDCLQGSDCGVIITGSSMEYPPSVSGDGEGDSGRPATPYGQSKLAETTRAEALARLCNVGTRVARLYIPFGLLDNPTKLIAQVMARLQSGTAVALSPCTQRRDFLGISDICTAYEKLVADFGRTTFDVFNVASGEGVVLRDFLFALAERLGASRTLLHFGEIAMRPGEPEISFANIDKVRRLLYWNPRPLATAIDEDLIGALAR